MENLHISSTLSSLHLYWASFVCFIYLFILFFYKLIYNIFSNRVKDTPPPPKSKSGLFYSLNASEDLR